MELIERRTRNTRHYTTDAIGVYRAEIHSKSIHYESSPGTGDWQPIDEYLSAHANGWMREHNYHQVYLADDYAAEWPVTITRRAGWTLRHKVAAVVHVATETDRTPTLLQTARAAVGESFVAEGHASSIRYPGVFAGVDVRYHVGNDRLSKEIIISEAAKLALRQAIVNRSLDPHGYLAIATQVEWTAGGWQFGLAQDVETAGDVRLSGPQDWPRRVRDRLARPTVADARGDTAPPAAMLTRFVELPGHGPTLLYLLPLDWLRDSAGDVVIDPSYYGETADGYIFGMNAVYATARSTSYATIGDQTYLGIGQRISDYRCLRTFLSFDTSGIPDDAEVTDADLYVCAQSDESSDDFNIVCYRYAWAEALGDNREANYDGAYGGSATLEGTLRNTADGFVAGTYYSMAVATAGINKTGDSKYTLVSEEDVNNSTPTTDEYVFIRSAEYANTSSGPYLDITYTTGAAPIAIYHYRRKRV